jgi:enamine deaminase RidA (YjgF/YER057c/UK114 family)
MLLTRQMEYEAVDCGSLPVSVRVSRFRGSGGVEEVNVVARPTEYATVETQLDWIARGYREALERVGTDAGTAVLRRFFCSDLLNQAEALEACGVSSRTKGDCAVSWVGQAPMPPSKAMLWAYHIVDPSGALDKRVEAGSVELRRGGLRHCWTTGLGCATRETSYDQTRTILREYEAFLRGRGMSLAGNAMRTWFFVRNIDANYHGLVAARREFFAEHGLTPQTHFIASTGIEGACVSATGKVCLDAYAIGGVRPEQVEYLVAPEHLSPTHVYGVTFERATAVAYRDRRQVLLSGTASIDAQGQIVHPGDVERQLERTLENVEALLARGGATLGDLGAIVAYVRDPGDHEVVANRLQERFGDAPVAVVVAPVCRPGWLVEIEGQASVGAEDETAGEF